MKHLILFENFEEETNESTSATGGLAVSTGVSGGPASGLAGQTLSTNWASSTNKVSYHGYKEPNCRLKHYDSQVFYQSKK